MGLTVNGQLYTDIALEVFKLGGLLVVEGDELTKDLGLTSARWKVLGALALTDSPKTVSQIAHFMGQTRQGVQRISDAMVAAGFMVYEDNPRHKRAKLVALTPKGKLAYQAIDQKQIPWANKKSNDISAEEMTIALQVLKTMSSGLEV